MQTASQIGLLTIEWFKNHAQNMSERQSTWLFMITELFVEPAYIFLTQSRVVPWEEAWVIMGVVFHPLFSNLYYGCDLWKQ